MKTLSILQPWASLIAQGHKKIETRSWNTKYRGPILIHASAGKYRTNRYINMDLQQEYYRLNLERYEDLPFGAIIGKVDLIDSCKTEDLVFENIDRVIKIKIGNSNHNDGIESSYEYLMTKRELAFGDYTPGRYGWLLANPILFAHPIPAKGKLGLWEYDMPEHFHIANNYGGHATFNSPPTKQIIDAVNKLAEIGYKNFVEP